MIAIKVNRETIRPSDLCIDSCADHQSLIEYWVMHEIEDMCESDEIADRLCETLFAFGRAPEFTKITFSAVLDGEARTITIEKL